MWPVSLELMPSTLGQRILLIEDEAATARTLALRTPVQAHQQPFGNVSRPPRAKAAGISPQASAHNRSRSAKARQQTRLIE